MQDNTRHYLLRLEFLGFRYHGWQQQPNLRTVEGMLRKTLRFVLPNARVSVLGAGRTDAMVSALDFAAGLILKEPPPCFSGELAELINTNLPPDIRLVSLTHAEPDFNVIQDVVSKTYAYYFSYGPKPHPYSAPYMGYFSGNHDLKLMKQAAVHFEGTHDFSSFIAGPLEGKKTNRTIYSCKLALNTELTASFFPDPSYVLKVAGRGFGRYQVRMMMAAIAAIGKGEASLESLKAALHKDDKWTLGGIAPASGLHLVRVAYDKSDD